MMSADQPSTTLSAAWTDAPRACPDPSCRSDGDDCIGLVMRAYRPLQIAAIAPDDRTAAQFFWTCGACGLRWGQPARPLVDLFLRALHRVSPERMVQAGATETIRLGALADLAEPAAKP